MPDTVRGFILALLAAATTLSAAPQPQNASGTSGWDFGQVYRDRDYKVTYPLTNNCKVGQTVTITYPTTINLTGPTEVAVGPYATENVPMLLKMSQPPLPRPPYPIGTQFDCHEVTGDLTLVHPELVAVEGDVTYTCHGMERTHNITMFVHQHGPPSPPDAGGGRGKKKASPACQNLWDHNEFYPSPTVLDPSGCRDEIRQLAIDFVEEEVKPLSAADKAKLDWVWVPNRPQLEQMSVVELLHVKERANELAAMRRKK